MIYFLQPASGGPIKIGFTEDLEVRVKALQWHYRQPLVLLATMEGGRDEERALHKRFAHLRFGQTEQFRPSAELMAFIGRPLLVDQNSESVEAMPVPADGRRSAVTNIRSSAEWKAWLERLAVFHRSPSLADLVDDALVELAQRIGFEETAPRR